MNYKKKLKLEYNKKRQKIKTTFQDERVIPSDYGERVMPKGKLR